MVKYIFHRWSWHQSPASALKCDDLVRAEHSSDKVHSNCACHAGGGQFRSLMRRPVLAKLASTNQSLVFSFAVLWFSLFGNAV